MDNFSDTAQLRVQGLWANIWKLRVSPKIRVFVWRSCRNCLPTRTHLRDKGVECPSICVCCNVDLESRWHSLLTCTRAQAYWKELHLWQVLEPQLVHHEIFKDLFFHVLSGLTPEDQAMFAVTFSSLWTSRNTKLWEGREETVSEILFRGHSVLYTWVSAKHNELVSRVPPTL